VNLSNFVVGPDGSLTNVDREWVSAGPVDADLVCVRALWYFAKDLVMRGSAHPWPSESTIDEVACRLAVLSDVPVSPPTLSRLSEAEGNLQALVRGSSAEAVRRQIEAFGQCSSRTLEVSRHLPFRRLRAENADLQRRLVACERTPTSYGSPLRGVSRGHCVSSAACSPDGLLAPPATAGQLGPSRPWGPLAIRAEASSA
jgi:hypothetical protein